MTDRPPPSQVGPLPFATTNQRPASHHSVFVREPMSTVHQMTRLPAPRLPNSRLLSTRVMGHARPSAQWTRPGSKPLTPRGGRFDTRQP